MKPPRAWVCGVKGEGEKFDHIEIAHTAGKAKAAGISIHMSVMSAAGCSARGVVEVLSEDK